MEEHVKFHSFSQLLFGAGNTEMTNTGSVPLKSLPSRREHRKYQLPDRGISLP
jgi:hypothetical protein